MQGLGLIQGLDEDVPEAAAKTREEPQWTLRLQGDHYKSSQEHRQKQSLLSADSARPLCFCQLKPTQIPGELVHSLCLLLSVPESLFQFYSYSRKVCK